MTEHSPTTTAAADEPAPLVQRLMAEALGTFVLVLIGCGSVAFWAGQNTAGTGLTLTSIGLSFGLAVTVMAYAVGRVSGGHFNPAVSTGVAMSGRISWKDAGLYMAAQVVSAILAALVLFILLNGWENFDAETGMGANSFGDDGSGYAIWAAFLLELLMTFLFVLIILALSDSRNPNGLLAPLAIGLTLAIIHFATIPATGTSVNPARSIGPALFAGADHIIMLWLFILAPLLGGALAGLAYPAMFGRPEAVVPGSGLNFSAPKRRPQQGAPAGWAGQQGGQQWGQQDGYQQWEQPSQPSQPGHVAPGQVPPAQAAPGQYAPQQYPQHDPYAQGGPHSQGGQYQGGSSAYPTEQPGQYQAAPQQDYQQWEQPSQPSQPGHVDPSQQWSGQAADRTQQFPHTDDDGGTQIR